ncbi:MAM domain-containing glycosylphosphatidylinositol anchor protein 1 [Holothuria leucospilota]|uniref:MAM domain-containing glycosylphosphatidylinositol anchor protein 1 n=1 Tax=Holothuria leucospilota TaxID=206669 RepID=A0A9Q0YJX4_HOLLE|nr:MAM domain-containing glycosylphosphatidylinositol anchor protein 1 [Holothuria leucospilota]
MYIETSAPSISVARLASPSQLATNEGFCLEFYYHMYGTSIGTLNVFLSSGDDFSQEDQIFTRSESQGNRWRQSLSYVNSPSSHWRIIFEGRKGQGSSYGDIAIDDVSFISGPCPTQGKT